jgi:hypothetical protein
MCTDATVQQISTPYKKHVLQIRIASLPHLIITSKVDHAVHSSNARANLSYIEITWYLGKNCMTIRIVHIILNFQQANDVVQSADAWILLFSFEIV